MTVAEPIKILYVISSLANEGPTRVLLNIVRNLDRTCFSPAIATLTEEKENSLLPEFRALGVSVFQLSSGASGAFARVCALRRLLLSGGFRLAHSHCPRSLFFLVASGVRGVKTLYTAHIYPDLQYRVIHGFVKGSIITIASHLALRFINRPIACAESVAAEYEERRGSSFLAINNGIEAISLKGIGSRAEVLADLKLDPSRRYLLSIGRLSAEKRIYELARSFSKVPLSNVDLLVVGAGPEIGKIETVVSPRIHLMGFHNDIRPFLVACDAYVSPSATEGLANTLLETMSVGLPSLLSDIPSHRFFIQACQGFVGCLFNPMSEESLFEGLKAVLEHDLPDVRCGIQDNFRKLFQAKVMTSGYEAVYREMLT